jgi:hypothetical protein
MAFGCTDTFVGGDLGSERFPIKSQQTQASTDQRARGLEEQHLPQRR